jgi:hypothetical protein
MLDKDIGSQEMIQAEDHGAGNAEKSVLVCLAMQKTALSIIADSLAASLEEAMVYPVELSSQCKFQNIILPSARH